MTAGAPKDILDREVAQSLRHFGLDAEAVVNRGYSGDLLTDIRVQTGDGMGAMVTMWRGGADGYEFLDEAIGSLPKRKEVTFAVAVCYPDDLASESIEEARYVWRVKPRVGAKSGLMSGGVGALALAISLAFGSPREPGPVARSLADSLVADNRDTLIVALPLFTATGNVRKGIRRRLQQDYWVHFIVASHDPEREQFSLNGRGPEVLVVCKPRAANQSEPSATRVVNLAVSPPDSKKAQAVASSILDCIDSEDDVIQSGGTVREISFAELYEGDWRAAQFISPYLREQLLKLRRGCIFPMTKLLAITDIEPTGGMVRRVFVPERPTPKTCEFISLWGQDNRRIHKMRPKAESSVWAHPDPRKSVSASTYWEKRSHLLLPVAPYLPEAKAMAVRLDEPTLGSLWTNATIKRPESEQADYEKALCVYFNSTIGILSMVGSFKRMGLLFRLESTARDLKRLPVPDFATCGGALKALAAAFDKLGERELSPLPEADTCPVRYAIDRAVCEALGIQEELVHRIRWHLVGEPSVTGKRYQVGRQMSFLTLAPKE